MKELKMNAVAYTQYGSADVLHLVTVNKPEPKDNEVLIRIKATAVNSGDVRLRKADPFAVRFIFGLMKPKLNILGTVFSGEVESVGKDVKTFAPGDHVFGHTDMKFGAYAEYICVPENGSIAIKPTNISHNEASAIPFGGVTALHFIKKAMIKPNQKILVVGALGAVGSAAIQLAKVQGAIVTGVCNTSQIDLVKSIGADKVIDYTKEDFTQNGEIYDVIFDTINAISVIGAQKSLSKNGTMILSSAGMSEMIIGSMISMMSGKKVLQGVISHSGAAIQYLKELIELGKYKPLVDKAFSLGQISEAHTYFEKGSRKGSITINIQ